MERSIRSVKVAKIKILGEFLQEIYDHLEYGEPSQEGVVKYIEDALGVTLEWEFDDWYDWKDAQLNKDIKLGVCR